MPTPAFIAALAGLVRRARSLGRAVQLPGWPLLPDRRSQAAHWHDANCADGDAFQTRPLRLLIFDCDGVLIDSEPLSDVWWLQEFTALGWPITPAECGRLFLGMSFYDMVR